MSKIKTSLLYFACSALLLTSCASLNGGKIKYQKINTTSIEKEKFKQNETQSIQIKPQEFEEISASINNGFAADNTAKLAVVEISTMELSDPEANCDTLFMKDGKEISVKIIEIGIELIKYKRCEFLDGPTYSINASDAASITYSNGTKEEIKAAQQKDSTPASKPKTQIAGLILGIVGFTLGLVFSIITSQLLLLIGAALGLLAMILAINASIMLKKKPDAKIGRTLGAISAIVGGLSLVALTFTFIFAILF